LVSTNAFSLFWNLFVVVVVVTTTTMTAAATMRLILRVRSRF
jgi:hypothetical protein